MVAITVLIFTVALSLYALNNEKVMDKLLLYPYRLNRNGDYYTFVSSGLIHADIPHLLFNGFSFYFFAFSLESIVGSVTFFWIYFGSMIFASIPSSVIHKHNPSYRTLGASGAISGAIFAYVLYEPGQYFQLLLLPIPIPSPIFAILFLVGSYFASKRGGDNINHDAHIFGAISGAVLAIILDFILEGGNLLPNFVSTLNWMVESALS
ncbi:MAG: rhomboid family intramembrane serine protease [Chloroherpetonaceae bacterium]|nr:rhomboid family intramembrane serine protease [Chloroherpetonaceae bacterium]